MLCITPFRTEWLILLKVECRFSFAASYILNSEIFLDSRFVSYPNKEVLPVAEGSDPREVLNCGAVVPLFWLVEVLLLVIILFVLLVDSADNIDFLFRDHLQGIEIEDHDWDIWSDKVLFCDYYGLFVDGHIHARDKVVREGSEEIYKRF